MKEYTSPLKVLTAAILGSAMLVGCSSDNDSKTVTCGGTIAEIADCNSDFDTLFAAVDAAGADLAINVFAPTDAAFALIGTPAEILATQGLDDILKQHVINGAAIDSISAYAANGTAIAILRTGTDLNVSIDGNICRNACNYTQKGEVKVTVFDKGLYISDTGPGVEAELLPHLFERHTRSRGNQQAGEGIGLAIVKRLCDQFNWNITIENRPSSGVLVTLLKYP